jgi:hypothetical protein
MTRKQAMAMNARFLSMDSTIKSYDEAYKYKYYQLHQARQGMAKQDSIIAELNRQLKIKPSFKPITKLDLVMAGFFVSFSSLILYLNY